MADSIGRAYGMITWPVQPYPQPLERDCKPARSGDASERCGARCPRSQAVDQSFVDLTMSELGSIIQKAYEERDKMPLSVYGLAGPLAHRA